MNLQQVLEVEKSGLVTIGAHTMNHPILANETDIDSEAEIQQSVNKLRDLLGHEVKYFAYPNGKPILDFGRREMEYLKDAGITIALSMQIKHLSSTDHRLALPRIGITAGSPRFIKLKLKLGARFEKIKSIIRQTENKQRKKIAHLKSQGH
jgi:peptidoglycan/xylan/chitin deacetylase (PgdA/CDA1 family)